MSSSYRVKFKKEEFLQLLKIAKPEYLFHVRRILFFSFQGFVVYSIECKKDDLKETDFAILEAVEFSNKDWNHTA